MDERQEQEIITELRKDMILRDYLAMDRTVLANQRTLLAYFRTFIALIAAGSGMVNLFDPPGFIVLGWVFIAASPLALVIGAWQYRKIKKRYTSELYK